VILFFSRTDPPHLHAAVKALLYQQLVFALWY